MAHKPTPKKKTLVSKEVLKALRSIALIHKAEYLRLTKPAKSAASTFVRKVYDKIPEDLLKCINIRYNPNTRRPDYSEFYYRDLQRACIIRGLSPDDLVEGDHNTLQKWLDENIDKKIDISHLDYFDHWRESMLAKDEPFVRLGYIGKVDEEGEPVNVFKPKPKKPKKHIEKDANMGGIWKGTKKHLTIQCKKDGLNLDKTIAKVLADFPDAKESSIKIWYKRS